MLFSKPKKLKRAMNENIRNEILVPLERFHREVRRPQVHRLRRVGPRQVPHLLVLMTQHSTSKVGPSVCRNLDRATLFDISV